MWMKSTEVNTAFNVIAVSNNKVPRGQLLLHSPIQDEKSHTKGSFEFTSQASAKRGAIIWSYPPLEVPNARFEPFN